MRQLLLVLALICAIEGASIRAPNGQMFSLDEIDPQCEKADVIFILDSSGSIGANNWQKVLNFAKRIASDLVIGPDNVQIGIVTYGNRATLQFDLNTFTDSETMMRAIEKIPWKDQATNTSGGIRYAKEYMFKRDKGDRADAPNIGIVITDGESNRDEDLTIPEARLARGTGITLFAVAIGDEVKQEEIDGIATPPIQDYVFKADSFEALDMIRAAVVARTCLVQTDCRQLGDYMMVLDTSGSVGEKNFDKVKAFMSEFSKKIEISQGFGKVGVITFSDDAKMAFDMNSFTNNSMMRQSMGDIKYDAGKTNTASALRMLRSSYNGASGDRPDHRNVAVVFTDGGSNNFKDTLEAAREAKNDGITVLVVPIGGWVNEQEIQLMASDPVDKNIFKVDDFDQISSIQNELKAAMCNDVNECGSNPCLNGAICEDVINKYICRCAPGFSGINCEKVCRQPADVVFSIDSSTSIGLVNFYKMMGFVKDTVDRMNINPQSGIRVSLETFSDSETSRFNLNQFGTKELVMNALNVEYTPGTTDTAGAFRMMREQLFNNVAGDRNSVRNVGITFTDGRSNDKKESFKQAVANRKRDIELVTVSVGRGNEYRQRELRGITSDPDNKNLIYLNDFQDFDTRKEELYNTMIDYVCNNVDECAAEPCQSGGTCVDGLNGYTCKCPFGRSGINCERGCDGQADIVIMIDNSGSIRQDRFEMLKDFARSIVNQFEVTPERARFGLITFADDAQQHFMLNTYDRKEDVMQVIDTLSYSRGKTNIASALILMQALFNRERGDRETVPNFGILITDGQATMQKDNTLPEAIKARISGVHLIVASPEGKGKTLEFRGIASRPVEENIFVVDNYDSLTAIRGKVVGATCDDRDECASNPCRNGGQCVNGLKQYLCLCRGEFTGPTCERRCSRRLDVTFILDASGSAESMYVTIQEMAKELVNGLNWDGSRTRVGVVTFSDSATIEFSLNTYSSRLEVINAIAFLQTPGKTNTQEAIRRARQEVFNSQNGDRTGDPNVLIVLTDGWSNVIEQNTLPEAEEAKKQGIRVITVGVGKAIQRSEIEAMATSPASENAFFVESDDQIKEQTAKILDTLCN